RFLVRFGLINHQARAAPTDVALAESLVVGGDSRAAGAVADDGSSDRLSEDLARHRIPTHALRPAGGESSPKTSVISSTPYVQFAQSNLRLAPVPSPLRRSQPPSPHPLDSSSSPTPFSVLEGLHGSGHPDPDFSNPPFSTTSSLAAAPPAAAPPLARASMTA